MNLLFDFQKKTDSIINSAIQQKAFPGCAVYASVGDSILISQAYGFHTYDSLQPVLEKDLYDLASVTKVLGSSLALMKLYEDGLIDLDAPLKNYVNGLGWSRLGKVTLRQCLAHQAGLTSWIKFYERIQRKRGGFKNKTIADEASEQYGYAITEDKYLHRDFYRKLKRMIRKSPVNPEQGYMYSDLFFYLVPELVQQASGLLFDEYLRTHFYDSLGAKTLVFNPQDQFFDYQIVPTEVDSFFRQAPIDGKVHDEGAILMGGVSGHAGLFGSLPDVAKVMRMLVKGGTYEDRQYLKPQTIQLFTTYQYPNQANRRGLGFDKPLLEYDSLISSVAQQASIYSFGQTGFTGTLVWADPVDEVVFVFLSNRVYPTRQSKVIYQLNVRPSIHELLYECAPQSNSLR